MSSQSPYINQTILTIDDEPTIRQSFRAYLEDMDFQVLEADGGASGVEVFEKHRPDLVLVDLNMPEMDGLEVLEVIRKKAPETPLIVISGTGRLSDIAQALRLGAWDYLFKPIHDMTVLEHAIERTLERADLLKGQKLYQEQLEFQVAHRTQELKESEEKYRHIFENLQDVYFETTFEGIITEISPSICRSSQYTRDDLINTDIQPLYRSESARQDFLETLSKKQTVKQYEVEFCDKDGTFIQCAINARVAEDSKTGNIKICGSFQNITERKETELALIKSEEQYRSLVSNIPVGLYRYSLEGGGSYITANQAMANILGYDSIEELTNTHPNDLYFSQKEQEIFFNRLLSQGKVISSEIQVKRKDGSSIWTALSAYIFRNKHGIIEYIDTMIEDISLRKEAEQAVQHLSYYDYLTELPNRTMFLYRLKQALSSSRRNNTFGGAVLIDLDRFKAINDSLGHHLGDLFLQKVAKRLLSQIRDEDTVARIGGDEFAIIFSELSMSIEEAGRVIQSIAEKIRADLTRPIIIDGHELYITASIGIAMFPQEAEKSEEVLKHASTAVTRVKAGQRNQCLFYLPDMQQAASKRLTIEKELRLALNNNDFQLYYQPQVDVDGNIIGAEALIRWTHPERGIISPADFIPVAEETGLILQIGNWVIQTACSDIKSLIELGYAKNLRYISINVSPAQFKQEDFTDIVETTLATTAIPPALLSIEITEGVAIDDLEGTIDKMNLLKELGISFSLDDFGTGYSSLSYINRLPIDQLKIDRSFVTGVAEDSSFSSIVSTIIVMAKSMGLDVVAEGVETESELQFLFEKECRTFQGFYFSRPVPFDEFKQKLRG